MRRGIDDGKFHTMVQCSSQNLGQAGRLSGDDRGSFVCSEILPTGSAGLRVQINDCHTLVSFPGADSEMQCQGSFPGSAFLRDDGNGLHAGFVAASHPRVYWYSVRRGYLATCPQNNMSRVNLVPGGKKGTTNGLAPVRLAGHAKPFVPRAAAHAY